VDNLKHEHGPFDMIGDVHGCFDELRLLLERLGYEITSSSENNNSLVIRFVMRKVVKRFSSAIWLTAGRRFQRCSGL